MNRGDEREPSSFWLRLLHGALRLYPSSHRAEYGDEIGEVFRERVRDARDGCSRLRLIGFQLKEVKGLVRDGLRARWETWSGGPHPERPAGPHREHRNRWIASGTLADARFALRGLVRSPGFTFSAMAVLALGLGATVTAFAALKLSVFTPPPFPNADRLVSVDLTYAESDGARITRWAYPYVERLAQWPDRLVDPVTSYRDGVATLTGLGPSSHVELEVVSPGYFSVVGHRLTLGRGFRSEEADPSGPYGVTVVSHAFWQTMLGGSPAALGREIELNGRRFEIVGVAPRGFAGFGGRATLWLPLGAYAVLQPGVLGEAGNHVAWMVGRLRPGAAFEAAQAQMEFVGQAIAEEWPRSETYGVSLRPFSDAWMNPNARMASVLLVAASGLVLLVTCANLGGLLFTRARRRVREGAVRRALGATRWRLVRAHLVESLTISLIGGAAGLMLSGWGMGLLSAAWPSQFLGGNGIGLQVIDPDGLVIDGTVIVFAAFMSMVTALAIGLVPALRISSFDIVDHLKDVPSRAKTGRRTGSMDAQVTLVGLQVALALMLLVGVGLMGSTVWRLLDVDEGFRSERLLSFEFSLPQDIPRFDPRDDAGWRSHIVAAASFDDQLQQRVSALPGVEGIALSSGAILKHFEAVLGVEVERRGEAPASMGSAGVVPVSDDYFSMLEIPIVQGRTFTRSDGLSGQPVVVLSQTAAATYFPNEDPIGKRVTTSFAPSGRETAEVVGVVGDVIYTGPGQQRWPVLYYSLRERNGPRSAMVRTAGNPIETVALIRDAMGALDPTVAMRNVTTMDRMIAGSIGDRRLMFGLLAIFASITVVLAAVGTWGVVAYAVAVRQRELGLRMALGAQSRGVLGLVLRKSAITAFAGVAFGWAGAFVVGRVLETFLWNTSPHDLRVFLSGSGLLLLIVLLASYAPARRAVRVDPAEVLRAAE